MSQFPNSFSGARSTGLDYESNVNTYTVGRFFNTVYAWMCVGLAVTAVVGYLVSTSSMINVIYGSKGGYVLIALIAFAIAWYVQSQAARIPTGLATVLFLVYAAVMGALLSGIYRIYPPAMLGGAFIMTGGVFGVMSLYGFVTKRDLTSIGSICVMLAIGFIVASFVNLWLASDALSWVITYAILALFVIITAYETQRLRKIAIQLQNNPTLAARYGIVGSLVLYIAFINLFISILRIMGGRR